MKRFESRYLAIQGYADYMEPYLAGLESKISSQERAQLETNLQKVVEDGWSREDQLEALKDAYRRLHHVPVKLDIPEGIVLQSWCAGELNS